MADVSYNIPDLRPGEVFRVEQTIKRSRFIASVGILPVSKKQKPSSNKLKPNLKMPGTTAGAYCAGSGRIYRPYRAASDDGDLTDARPPRLTAVTHSGIEEVTVVVTRLFRRNIARYRRACQSLSVLRQNGLRGRSHTYPYQNETHQIQR